MIKTPRDLFPHEYIDELLRIARINRNWVKITELGDTDFRVENIVDTPLRRAWADGSDALSMVAVSVWLIDGPKTFRPTAQQCRALEQIEVNINVKEYAQPYPAILIEPPAGMYGPFKAVLSYHLPAQNYVVLGLLSDDHTEDIVTCAKEDGNEMEVVLNKFRPDSRKFAKEATAIYRVAVNACLALVNFGCHKTHLFAKQVESDRRLAGEQSERGAKARDRIKQAVSIVTFAQEVHLHDGDNPAHTGPQGGSVTPHWRRGHWRMQVHGPKNSLRKRVLIKPVLVRADLFVGDLADTSAAYE